MQKKKTPLLSVAALILLILAGTWYREHDGAKDGLEKAAGEWAEKVRIARDGKTDALPRQGTDDPSQDSRQHKGLEIPYLLDTENNTIIEHMGFTLSYNERRRIPNWVAYELLDSELYGDFERTDSFRPDPSFKGRQAYDSDYRGSGWDRGHMAPSADMKWSSQVQEECFYLTNICPQNHNLNAGVWNDLEKRVRAEARYYKTLWVVCGPVVDRNRYGTIGDNQVTVPDGFFKALLARRRDGEYISIGFYFPNEAGRGPLSGYAMSVNDLEERIGMDLFYNLDPDVQEEVEGVFNPADWKIR